MDASTLLTGESATAHTAGTDGQPTTTTTTQTAAPAAAPAPAAPADQTATPAADGDTPKDGEGDKSTPTDAPKPDDKPAGAPEVYEFKVPEGMQLDEALIEQATPLLKAANLPQEQAQKFVDLYAEGVAKATQAAVEKTTGELLGALGMSDRAKWAEQCKTDADIGGEQFEQNIALANKAATTFGDKDLLDVMAKTGLGAHPAVIRMLVKVGKQISEDTFVSGNRTASAPRSAGDVLYGQSSRPTH